jgi:uncharacterized protein (TIGR02118 family)
MIRLTYLLRRKPGMSFDEFQTRWRTTHGPLAARHSMHLRCLKYVQVHTIEDESRVAMSRARGEMEPPYDGVIEMWWDNIETLEHALETEPGRQAAAELLEVEREFVNLPASPLWFNYEYPQVNPTPENIVARERSTIVKGYFPLRALSSLSDDEAQLYWRTQHGPLIRRQAWGRMLRYVQVHHFPHPLETSLREQRGTEVEPYLGHAESWRDRAAQGTPTLEGEAAGARAIEDEAKFIDFARSAMWYGKEHVFIDRL